MMQRRRRIAALDDQRREDVESALGLIQYHAQRPRIRRRFHAEILRDLPSLPPHKSLGYAYWLTALVITAMLGGIIKFYMTQTSFERTRGLEIRLWAGYRLLEQEISDLLAGGQVLNDEGEVLLDRTRDEIHTVSWRDDGSTVLDGSRLREEPEVSWCEGRRTVHVIIRGKPPDNYQNLVSVLDRLVAVANRGREYPARCRVVLVPAGADSLRLTIDTAQGWQPDRVWERDLAFTERYVAAQGHLEIIGKDHAVDDCTPSSLPSRGLRRVFIGDGYRLYEGVAEDGGTVAYALGLRSMSGVCIRVSGSYRPESPEIHASVRAMIESIKWDEKTIFVSESSRILGSQEGARTRVE